MIGPTIEGYEIHEVLGEGTMAVVYRASPRRPAQPSGQRSVAVKVIKRGMDSQLVRARFAAELKALARMNHDAVTRVLDGGTTGDGRPYLVMEYVNGQPITEYCARRDHSLRDRIELFLAACEGVVHAHRRAILHRDLKPEHMLVSESSGMPTVKVIDFGLARLDDTAEDSDRSRGTLIYTSPEVVADPAAAGVRSELWSLGVVLRELLLGRHRMDEQAPTELPSDLEAIVGKACAAQPERRYSSVRELAADLRRFLAGRPIHARPTSGIEKFVKFSRRNRVAIGLAAAVGITLAWTAVSLIVSFVGARSALAAARIAQAEAIEQERSATASLRRFDILAGIPRLRRARLTATHLGPPWPRSIAGRRHWIEEEAQPLLALRAEIQRALADAKHKRQAADPGVSAFLHHALESLGNDLQDFASGEVARQRKRTAWAEELERLSITEQASAWQRAIAAVVANDRFGGLRLTPQLGLVPLGADPDSGYQEFAHLRSGRVPRRGADGALDCGLDTGMVFVLIPPGTAKIGTPPTDRVLQRLWRERGYLEMPQHEVTLNAFFLAKHEMSQGQWSRLTGANPSWFRAGSPRDGIHYTLAHPVENVSWLDCDRQLRDNGLCLPTEVQWEYACRAGTDTAWWSGERRDSLAGTANISASGIWPDHRDAFDGTAVVQALQANPFGLHQTMGNVSEWCADAIVGYQNWPEPGNGLRAPIGADRVHRGGSWARGLMFARCAARGANGEEEADQTCGLRAARAIR